MHCLPNFHNLTLNDISFCNNAPCFAGAVRQRRSHNSNNVHESNRWQQSRQQSRQQHRNRISHQSKELHSKVKPFHHNLQPSTRKRLVRLENLSKQKPWTKNYANLLMIFLHKAENEAKADVQKFIKWLSPNYRRLARAIYRRKKRSRRRKRRAKYIETKARKKQKNIKNSNDNHHFDNEQVNEKIKTDSKKQT